MIPLSHRPLTDTPPQSKSLDFAIIELAERLASMSTARGYAVKPYTQKSLVTLATLPVEKKQSLIANLQTTINIFTSGTEIEKINPSVDHPERRLVEMALDFYGYRIDNEDFWKTIKRNELVEIYNTENIQIFRTFNFFKTSSYSILDLLINEWYNLWERPNGVFDNMFKVIGSLFSGEIKGIAPAGVPEHVINEIFNAEDEIHFISRSSLCRFGIVCPIYDKRDGKIGGLLVSAQVTPVALGRHARNISFI